MTTRTAIVFPVYIGSLTGVQRIDVGPTFVWIVMGNRTVRVARSAFTVDELADQSNDLAFRARQIADAIPA